MSLETSYDDILFNFIRQAKVRTVLELGVGPGYSTQKILQALGGKGLWSVDISPCTGIRERISEDYPDWVFIQEDDRKLKWTRKVDLIFIDTSHQYEHTLEELEKYSPYAQHWIFLHDTRSNPQVEDAIKTFLLTDENWAWSEWEHGWGLALLMRLVREDEKA